MPLRFWSRPSESRRRGLSLVETSIVLAVGALIIGAIFATLAPSRNQSTVNQASDELNTVVANVRDLYNGQGVPTVGSCANFPATATAVAATTGIFPREMISGAITNNVWNTASGTSTALVYLCGSNPVRLVVRYSGIPKKACIAALIRTSSQGAGMGLLQINVGGTAMTLDRASGNITLANATTSCVDGATVDWYYKLGN
jgi:hypothetical protein